MKNNSFNKLNPFLSGRATSKSLTIGAYKIKRSVYVMGVLFILAGCAAFSGRETAGEYLDDAAITGSVKSEILNDPKLKLFRIHVETFQNEVQLSGFVDSAAEKAEAERVARKVEGVRSVKNSIVVRKRTPKGR